MTDPVPGLAAAARLLDHGEASAVELMRASLARVDALEPSLHAFITVDPDRALRSAAEADAERRAGRRRGPLHGVPYALKDIIDAEGWPTTAHSRLRVDASPALRDAGVTEALGRAGMVLVGKQSLHEFARGSPHDSLPWPHAVSPWSFDRSCGGSSSGGGVSVAAGMVGLAVGTDTGGSIRVPAAFCGIVGLKPTYGRVSRRGIVPLSYSLDHAGPLTRTVEDCALALEAMSGFDPGDPGSARVSAGGFAAGLGQPVRGLRIGVARTFDSAYGVGAEQTEAVEASAQLLRALGADIVDVELPSAPLLDAATWTILLAESYALHRDALRTRWGDFGRTVRERTVLGAFVTGADLVQAQRHRRRLTDEMQAVFGTVDAVLCSTCPGPPPLVRDVDDGPWRRRQPMTAPFNLTGHPALAVPAGVSRDGLPLSVSFVGRFFDERGLLQIAHAHERAAGLDRLRPPERVPADGRRGGP
jgi:aspartyl-tRNA(Asn)/glutamyl-tRNA(Gln) amidotransferase subunit A